MNLEASYINKRSKNVLISALDKIVKHFTNEYEKIRSEMIQRLIKIIALEDI